MEKKRLAPTGYITVMLYPLFEFTPYRRDKRERHSCLLSSTLPSPPPTYHSTYVPIFVMADWIPYISTLVDWIDRHTVDTTYTYILHTVCIASIYKCMHAIYIYDVYILYVYTIYPHRYSCMEPKLFQIHLAFSYLYIFS